MGNGCRRHQVQVSRLVSDEVHCTPGLQKRPRLVFFVKFLAAKPSCVAADTSDVSLLSSGRNLRNEFMKSDLESQEIRLVRHSASLFFGPAPLETRVLQGFFCAARREGHW